MVFALALDQWFSLSCLLGTARKLARLVYMCSADLMKAYYRVLRKGGSVGDAAGLWGTRSVVMGCSVPV